ncbi:MAG: hypothetical protein S4CHLAM2_09570 [Chlamydiales bacterium]|nr:hypothetical protein [Chlamydiales bacterium]
MFIQPIALSESEMHQITNYEQNLIGKDRTSLSESLLEAATKCQELIKNNGRLAAEIQQQAEQLEAADLRIQTLKEQNEERNATLEAGNDLLKFVRYVGSPVVGGILFATGFGAPAAVAAATAVAGAGRAGNETIVEATEERETTVEETKSSALRALRFNHESYFLDVQDLTQEKTEMAGLLSRLLLSINQNDLQEQALTEKQKQNAEDLTAKAKEEKDLLKKLNAKGIFPILTTAAGKLPSYVGADRIYDKVGSATSGLFKNDQS